MTAKKRDFWDMFMQIPEYMSESDRALLRDSYCKLGKETVFDEASKRRIVPFVAHVLVELHMDEDYWSRIHDDWEQRNKKVLNILETIFDEFHRSGCISPVVTENFGATLVSNSCLGCFCSGDVDLSADPGEKEKIRSAMERLGLVRKVRKAYRAEIREDEYLCPDDWMKGFYINIVWLPVVREKEYTIDQRKVISWLSNERKISGDYQNMSIRVLSTEVMLIHCVYHLSVGHYYVAEPGIRLLTEVDRILRCCTLNWGRINDIVNELGINKRFCTALCLAHETLNTPIPEGYIQQAEKSREIQTLIHILLQDEEGIHKLHAPIGQLQRLYVDILSEPGIPLFAGIRKLLFAASFFMRHANLRKK